MKTTCSRCLWYSDWNRRSMSLFVYRTQLFWWRLLVVVVCDTVTYSLLPKSALMLADTFCLKVFQQQISLSSRHILWARSVQGRLFGTHAIIDELNSLLSTSRLYAAVIPNKTCSTRNYWYIRTALHRWQQCCTDSFIAWNVVGQHNDKCNSKWANRYQSELINNFLEAD